MAFGCNVQYKNVQFEKKRSALGKMWYSVEMFKVFLLKLSFHIILGIEKSQMQRKML